MRLNKFISHNSKYSRREADRLISEGFVKVNKQIVKDFSYQVQKGDRVFVKGKEIKKRGRFELTMIVYNKPKGALVTKKDDRGRTTIIIFCLVSLDILFQLVGLILQVRDYYY